MQNPQHLKTDTDWKALQYSNLYRIFIAIFFLALVFTRNIPEPLGEHNQAFFAILSYLYVFLAFVVSYVSLYKLLPYQIIVLVCVCIDILLLSLMMYTSGGLQSGFGLLLVIAVASGSILSTQKIAFFIAALATIAVLAIQLYTYVFENSTSENYTQASILGLAFFITSFSGNYLSTRLRTSEAIATRRAFEIQSLAKLNEQIIDRMQSGIIAIDQDYKVQLMNRSAKELLDYPYQSYGLTLREIAAELVEVVDDWQEMNISKSSLVTLENNLELRVGIAEIKNQQQPQTTILLIFLDDASKMRQQAQNIKLESLGRLAASIAHEVRNPLGAISHASQLLKESTELTKGDERLTDIIQTQSTRVNSIIENVLSISRRQQPNIEAIALGAWLERFKNEFIENTKINADDLIIELEPIDAVIHFDSTQLHQVLWNLAENAKRHSHSSPMITLRYGVTDNNQRPHLDIIDTGDGIKDEDQDKLFEPFFTTDKQGTGLGLYISKELCEINQASLHLESHAKGCCFRIVFPHT